MPKKRLYWANVTMPFQACKLRLQLDGQAQLTMPFPARPPWMHRRTYEEGHDAREVRLCRVLTDRGTEIDRLSGVGA